MKELYGIDMEANGQHSKLIDEISEPDIAISEEGYGRSHSIPQLILAGASVDDVFVIVLFTALTSLASTGTISSISFLNYQVSIISYG